MDKAVLGEHWVGRILSSLYVSLLPQKPLNSQMCSCIVHMKVACDLVEWAEVCPKTHGSWDCFLLCKLHIDSSFHGNWFSHWLGAAFRNADGLADSDRLLSVGTGPGKGAEREKLWLTAVGFAHLQQGCSLGVVSECGQCGCCVGDTPGRCSAVCWAPVLSVCTEYKGYADAKLSLKMEGFRSRQKRGGLSMPMQNL